MEAQKTEERRNPYSSSSSLGGGGKLRSARKGSSTKATPYDRPSSSNGRGILSLSSSSSSPSSSIASRVVNTASRLITSSASYVFSSFFGGGRNSLRIKSGQDDGPLAEKHAEKEKAKEKEKDKEEEEEVEEVEAMDASPLKNEIQQTDKFSHSYPNKEEFLNPDMRRDGSRGVSWGVNTSIYALDNNDRALDPSTSLDGPKKGLELIEVEEILKQKTLSRDEVNRLTGLLQTRVTDDSQSEDIIVTPLVAERPIPSITHTGDENFIAPMSEAQRWREERKKARSDLTPIEVARAYMGERTSMPTGLTLSVRGIDNQNDKVADHQPNRGSGILADRYQQIDKDSEVQSHLLLRDKRNHQMDKSYEIQPHLLGDRYRPSPIVRSSARTSSALRMSKQGSILDEGWMSVGPVRKARQRVFQTMNQSPYARGRSNSGENLTPRAPPMQSSNTARKILDTLEKLSPSPKGRPLDGDFSLNVERTPFGLDADKSDGRKIPEFSRFSNLRAGASNGKLDFESMSKTPLMKKLPPPPINFNNAKVGSPPQDKVPFDYSQPEAPAKVFATSVPLSATAAPISQGFLMGAMKEEPKPIESKLSFSSFMAPASNKPPSLGSFGVPSVPVTASAAFMPPRKEEDSQSNIRIKEGYPVKDNPGREDYSAKGNELGTFESAKGSEVGAGFVSNNTKESNTSLFGSSQSSSGFSFKPGNNSFSVSTIASESEVSNTGSFSFSKPQLNGTKSVESNIMTSSSLQPNPFLFSKPVASSQQVNTKLPVLNVSSVNAGFSFPPAVAPMTCLTPTFSVGSNNSTPLVSSSSPKGVSLTEPVFSFTSPSSGGIKMPVAILAPDEMLPGPTFTFGGSEQKSSSVSVTSPLPGSLFGSTGFDSGVFGSSTRPGSVVFGSTTGTAGDNLTVFGTENGFGSITGSGSATRFGSTPVFGSTFGSGSAGLGSTTGLDSANGFGSTVFSSTSGLDSGVLGSTTMSESASTMKLSASPPMAAFDLGGGFSSGPTGLEKSGRKFIKAKRRK